MSGFRDGREDTCMGMRGRGGGWVGAQSRGGTPAGCCKASGKVPGWGGGSNRNYYGPARRATGDNRAAGSMLGTRLKSAGAAACHAVHVARSAARTRDGALTAAVALR